MFLVLSLNKVYNVLWVYLTREKKKTFCYVHRSLSPLLLQDYDREAESWLLKKFSKWIFILKKSKSRRFVIRWSPREER